jgi:hypothetical protein
MRRHIAQLSGLFARPFYLFPPALVSDLDRLFCHP